MQVASIPSCFQMAPDMPLQAVHGKLTKVYKPRTGETRGKPWSFQDIVVTDKEGNEIKATLNNRDHLGQDWENVEVFIMGTHSEKNGWTGLKTKDDEYNGNVTRILWITPSATIDTAMQSDAQGYSTGEEPQQHPGEQPVHRTAPPPQGTRPAPQSRPEPSQPEPRPSHGRQAPPAAQSGDQGATPRKKIWMALEKCGYAHELCLAQAVKVANNFHAANPGMELTAEHFQGIATSMFIELGRGGHIRELPYPPRKESQAQQQQAPAPQPEPQPEPETQDEDVDEDNVPF